MVSPGSAGVPVCRAKAHPLGGCNSRPASVVPAGRHRNGCGGNEAVEAFDSPQGTRRACRPSRAVNAEQAPTTANAQAAPTGTGRRPPSGGEANDTSTLLIPPGSWRQQAWTREGGPHGKPRSVVGSGPGQRRCREARSRSVGVAQRGVVPARPWNGAGGKAPWSGRSARRSARGVMGDESANTKECREAPQGTACESEGGARVSVLSARRQVGPVGCAGPCGRAQSRVGGSAGS